MSTSRQKMFVSFDYDRDADLKLLLVGQSKHDDTPFVIWGSSVKEHIDGDWRGTRLRFSTVDVICILRGKNTHTAKGVGIERQIAKNLKRPYFLIAGYKNTVNGKPRRWSWSCSRP